MSRLAQFAVVEVRGAILSYLVREGVVTSQTISIDEIASDSEGDPTKRRVLLVEDDWRTHAALRKILTKLGWEVYSAMTVSGGLALLHLRPQAIILDMMLPDGDGMAVLRQVRAEQQTAMVAVTTGIEDRVRLEEIRHLAPDALLRKPLELDDLLKLLDGLGA